jgi:hypothetical protein
MAGVDTAGRTFADVQGVIRDIVLPNADVRPA